MNQKIKIYIYHPYSGKGGADLSISRLINGLDPKTFDITFISLNSPLIKKKITKKIKFIKLKSNRAALSFFEIKKIINKDIDYNKKIFISNQNFANVLSVLFLSNIKNLKLFLFERNHISELNYYKNVNDFIKKKIIYLLIKFLYRKADIVVTNSKESSIDLQKIISKKVITLYNPCYFDKYRVKKKRNRNKKLVILNVARLEHQKDHITLLKAFDYSSFKNQFKLIIIGYGSQYLKLRKFITNKKLNNVEIMQNKFNLKKYYQTSDLFILTSLYEGFPNVLIEAASNRIPIISSNFKSGAKEILLNQRGGFLYRVGDYKSLSKLIDMFYLNNKPFDEKEKNCFKNLKRFSHNLNIKLFKKILLSL